MAGERLVADLERRLADDWRDLEAILTALPAIEVVDSRYADWTKVGVLSVKGGRYITHMRKLVDVEKPLANSVTEAEAMVEAAEKAARHGVRAMVGFTYRRVPAIALARRLVAEGRIGDVRHVRAQYLQDWITDPEAPLSWRLDKSKAGSGSLGDIGAHIIDLTQYITGERITGPGHHSVILAPDGVHVASAGGVWSALVYGFGGFRDHGGRFSFDPRLPEDWTAIGFRLTIEGTAVAMMVASSAISAGAAITAQMM